MILARAIGFLIHAILIVFVIDVCVNWIRAGGGETQHSAVASAFVGHWSGTITQIAHAEPSLPRALFPKGIVIGGKELFSDAAYKQLGREIKTTYPATIIVRPGEVADHIGSYTFPECRGDLILLGATSAQILLEESLTSGHSACTNHTKITIRLKADGALNYNAQDAAHDLSASAILRKIS